MKENKNADKPSFVYRDGMTADTEYVEWLSDLKRRYKQSQLRTAVKANSEVLVLLEPWTRYCSQGS